MKKYSGLGLLLALMLSSLVAYKASAGSAEAGLTRADLTDGQLRVLDQRLDARIDEQKQLMALIQKLVEMDYQDKAAQRPAGAALSGPPKAAAAPVRAVAKKPAPPPVAAPWWQSFKINMAYTSGNDSYAVVNGKLVGHGQPVGANVVLESVSQDAVVLRQGEDVHTYPLKK